MEIKNNVLLSVNETDIINGHFRCPDDVTAIGDSVLYYNKSLKSIDFNNVISIGDCFLFNNETITEIDLKNVKTIGDKFLFNNETITEIDFKNVETIGNYFLHYNDIISEIDFKNVETIGNYFLTNNELINKIDLKNVKTIDDKFLFYNKSLTEIDFKNVKTIGNYFLYNNELLTSISINNVLLNILKVDNSTFVIESTKNVEDITVYKGYILKSINNGVFNKQDCFVAYKNNLYSHGNTLKESISDLNYKINRDFFKNEPIDMDTIITIERFRAITGACSFGVDSWIKENNIKTDKIKVSELLPILEKTNAYGLSSFKEMIKK